MSEYDVYNDKSIKNSAKVAESVDAPVSEAGGSYPVRVQVPLFALLITVETSVCLAQNYAYVYDVHCFNA